MRMSLILIPFQIILKPNLDLALNLSSNSSEQLQNAHNRKLYTQNLDLKRANTCI
jgi:hypothetical protein